MLFSQVQKRRCAQCWGPVVMRFNDATQSFEIVCPRGCEPGGHVSESYVEQRLAEDDFDYMRVAANYPDWIEEDEEERPPIEDQIATLYGRE